MLIYIVFIEIRIMQNNGQNLRENEEKSDRKTHFAKLMER